MRKEKVITILGDIKCPAVKYQPGNSLIDKDMVIWRCKEEAPGRETSRIWIEEGVYGKSKR